MMADRWARAELSRLAHRVLYIVDGRVRTWCGKPGGGFPVQGAQVMNRAPVHLDRCRQCDITSVASVELELIVDS